MVFGGTGCGFGGATGDGAGTGCGFGGYGMNPPMTFGRAESTAGLDRRHHRSATAIAIAAAAARRIYRRPSSKDRTVPKREFKPGNWGQQTGRKDPSKGDRADRAAGGLAQEVEEADIVCEGWLRQLNKRKLGAKHESASRWKQVYAILVRGTSQPISLDDA